MCILQWGQDKSMDYEGLIKSQTQKPDIAETKD